MVQAVHPTKMTTAVKIIGIAAIFAAIFLNGLGFGLLLDTSYTFLSDLKTGNLALRVKLFRWKSCVLININVFNQFNKALLSFFLAELRIVKEFNEKIIHLA